MSHAEPGYILAHPTARRISVHPEVRPTGLRRSAGIDLQWVAVIELTDGSGYRIPTDSERAAWRGVWALENAGMYIPDAVLDAAERGTR